MRLVPIHFDRLTIAALCVVLVSAVVVGWDLFGGGAAAAAAEAPAASPRPSPQADHGSQAPRHVSVQLEPPRPTLVAGEKGTLEVTLRLEQAAGDPLVFGRGAAPPIAWISAPKDSGIDFVNEGVPDKPGQQTMITFSVPEENHPNVVVANVEYRVHPRTKAGEHLLWIDVSAPLINSSGSEIHDVGVVSLPFEVDTHLGTKLLMLLVVAAAVFLFIVEWVRVDVVAILMMVLLPELGLLDAHYAFRGLSSNAVVAIIGVMIISYGLNRVGLVNRMIQPLLGFVGRSVARLAVVFSGLIAAVSSVMQNTGAAVLFLPAIRLVASRELKVPVSRVLMPIGMAAILGGTLTMVGTSPLILLNDLLPPEMPRFSFFELTPIGFALVLAGVAYLTTAGMRMLANRPASPPSADGDRDVVVGGPHGGAYGAISGPYELFVPEDYREGDLPQTITEIRRRFLVNIVAIAGKSGVLDVAPVPDTVIRRGLGLCAYGPEAAVTQFARDYGLILRNEPRMFKTSMFNPAVAGLVEVVISPRSELVGRTAKNIQFRQTFEVNALAVHQEGQTFYRELADRVLRSGDALLLHGTWKQFAALKSLHQNFIIISSCETDFQRPEKANHALLCFLATLALMIVSSFYFQGRAYNPAPLSICLMGGALAMILMRVMTISEAYRAVDWRTVFLLGGLIPLGMAVDQTGTAQWIARGIVAGLGSALTPLLLLIVLAFLSCAFTMVISNVGACTLLVPLGISLANQVGVDPRVAAIVVGIGVSNSFILPTHQVNALYMGPGEYRTRDYLKIGGGLSVIYIVTLVTMTYVFYL